MVVVSASELRAQERRAEKQIIQSHLEELAAEQEECERLDKAGEDVDVETAEASEPPAPASAAWPRPPEAVDLKLGRLVIAGCERLPKKSELLGEDVEPAIDESPMGYERWGPPDWAAGGGLALPGIGGSYPWPMEPRALTAHAAPLVDENVPG